VDKMLAKKRGEYKIHGEYDPMANARDARAASAEIECHLAAIRKIKRKGKPLEGEEGYMVFPQ
jgi:hypothetical protein